MDLTLHEASLMRTVNACQALQNTLPYVKESKIINT